MEEITNNIIGNEGNGIEEHIIYCKIVYLLKLSNNYNDLIEKDSFDIKVRN